MGYIARPPSNFLQLKSRVGGILLVSTVATNSNLYSIAIPDFSGTVIRASLDLYITQLRELSGADNFLSGLVYVEVDGGGGWTSAIDLTNQCFTVPNGLMESGSFLFQGHIDIKNEITKSSTLSVRFKDIACNANWIQVIGAQTCLNLYLR